MLLLFRLYMSCEAELLKFMYDVGLLGYRRLESPELFTLLLYW